MKAIMLAGGEGTRCYPFTYLSPKIAQEVGGIPLLEYMLSWFYGAPEIGKLYVAVRNDPMAETVQNYIDKRKHYLPKLLNLFGRLGFKVEQANPSLEIEVVRVRGWGTGGDLRIAINEITSIDGLGGDFLVCNADYVTVRRLPDGELSPQLNLSDIISYHKSCKTALNTVMTVAVVRVKQEEATRFGVARLDKAGKFNLVRGFMEKPRLDDVPEEPSINAGVYVIDGGFILSVLDQFLPERPDTNLEKTLIEQLAKDKSPRLAAYLLDLHAWFDVGTLEQLVDVNFYVTSMKGAR